MQDGKLDEIVATNATVHLEQMDTGSWYLGIEAGGKLVQVWLPTRGKSTPYWEVSDD
jgi:hypothetical protein